MGSPTLHRKEQNLQWPTNEQIGDVRTPVWAVPDASQPEGKSIVTQKWADWRHYAYQPQGPQCLRAGDKISSGPQVGILATQPLSPKGHYNFRAREKMSSGPQVGYIGYNAVFRVLNGSQQGRNSALACKRGKLATQPLPSGGSPTLKSGRQNEQCPTSGQTGYITAAILGVPNDYGRGTKSTKAHKGANCKHKPFQVGGPQGFTRGDKTGSGRHVASLGT